MLGKLRLTTFKVQSTGGWLVYFEWDLKVACDKATKGSAATGNYPIALSSIGSWEVWRSFPPFVFSMRKHHGTRNVWNIWKAEKSRFWKSSSFFQAKKTTQFLQGFSPENRGRHGIRNSEKKRSSHTRHFRSRNSCPFLGDIETSTLGIDVFGVQWLNDLWGGSYSSSEVLDSLNGSPQFV